MNLITITTFLLLLASPGTRADSVANRTDYFSHETLKQDLDTFFYYLENTHPKLDWKISMDQYNKLKKEAYIKINEGMDYESFYGLLNSILVEIGDGHTYLDERMDNKNRKYAFFTVKIIEDKVVVDSVFSEEVAKILPKGSVILNIEGRSALEYVVKKALNTPYNSLVNSIYNSIMGFPFSSPDNDTLRIAISLPENRRVKIVKVPLHPIDSFIRKKLIDYYIGEDLYKISYFPEKGYALLKWNKFIDRMMLEKAGMDSFMDKPVKEIPYFIDILVELINGMKERGIKNLVVDIRKNPGGSSILGNIFYYAIFGKRDAQQFSSKGLLRLSPLLDRHTYYLDGGEEFLEFLKKKVGVGEVITFTEYENYLKEFKGTSGEETDKEIDFMGYIPRKLKNNLRKIAGTWKGRVFILTSPFVFSSSESFLCGIKDNHLPAILVGEPSGGGGNCVPGDILPFTLPNTKISGYISYKFFYRPDTTKCWQKAVFPDYYITQTYDDYLKGKDTKLEFVEKLIEGN